MTKAHIHDLFGMIALLAIFVAALFLARLVAGAVIGLGQVVMS